MPPIPPVIIDFPRCQPTVSTHPSRPNLWWPSLAGLAGFLAIAACGALAPLLPLSTPWAATASDQDLRCLALTLYWEAREDSRPGMLAVGWVVLNRRDRAKFPSTICEVVREGSETPPCQFSYWCDGKRDEPTEGESWRLASAVATELLSAPPPDPTHGAIFYHRDDIRPAWSTKHRRTAQVGRHFFYR
jgi:spore germination cell wall hydrolase CwlJ-like protein